MSAGIYRTKRLYAKITTDPHSITPYRPLKNKQKQTKRKRESKNKTKKKKNEKKTGKEKMKTTNKTKNKKKTKSPCSHGGKKKTKMRPRWALDPMGSLHGPQFWLPPGVPMGRCPEGVGGWASMGRCSRWNGLHGPRFLGSNRWVPLWVSGDALFLFCFRF